MNFVFEKLIFCNEQKFKPISKQLDLSKSDFREIMEDLGVMGIKVQLDFRGLRVTKVNLDRVQQAHLVWMDCLDYLEEKASGDSLE